MCFTTRALQNSDVVHTVNLYQVLCPGPDTESLCLIWEQWSAEHLLIDLHPPPTEGETSYSPMLVTTQRLQRRTGCLLVTIVLQDVFCADNWLSPLPVWLQLEFCSNMTTSQGTEGWGIITKLKPLSDVWSFLTQSQGKKTQKAPSFQASKPGSAHA